MTVDIQIKKIEFGDFQTPDSLAGIACQTLGLQKKYKTIIEPTCGRGAFLTSALRAYDGYEQAYGIEVNSAYLEDAKNQIAINKLKNVNLIRANFFEFNWQDLLKDTPDPILIIGNPPWVTNSTLGGLKSGNLPEKINFNNSKGIEAITGKSNFDISEWMLLQFLLWLNGRTGTLAMLCKTSVARKVLKYAWENDFELASSKLYHIDAVESFGASVDACFLVCEFLPGFSSTECDLYEALEAEIKKSTFGFFENQLIANIPLFKKHSFLKGKSGYTWRSGIKHDCSMVMELSSDGASFKNGLGETVDIEEEFLYPMLKSSDVNNGCSPRKWMVVPQQYIGEDTYILKNLAPKTWSYLETHKDLLAKRKSSIYKNKPPFSIFGVGSYSFSPWKICISGLYKNLKFKLVGPHENKPIVCDDTVYFLPCSSKEEAEVLYDSLNSDAAHSFYHSYIFWDAKRPITADMLNRLHVEKLLQSLGYVALHTDQQLRLAY